MTRSGGSRVQTGFWVCAARAVLCVLCGAVAAALLGASGADTAVLRDQVVALNEVRVGLAADSASDGVGESGAQAADAALADAQASLRSIAEQRDSAAIASIAVLVIAALIAVGGMAAYLHRSIVAPFLRLEGFAAQVAEGDLDAPLAYERSNPFGRFAWAFDHLRVQLKRSRAAEEQAAEAHKTALASLSHDLRTPLAALRTHAEALELGLARTPEERRGYEQLIMRKCDEAAALVEDLLTHALADMERLAVTRERTPAAPVVEGCIASFASAPITCTRLDEADLMVDPKRLTQVIDNLLANAAKYAPGAAVEVSGTCAGSRYLICVRDHGPGVAPEDMPFIRQRFYRGANADGQPGAGLGLFIAEHLVERMAGELSVEAVEPGLRVTLSLPLG